MRNVRKEYSLVEGRGAGSMIGRLWGCSGMRWDERCVDSED